MSHVKKTKVKRHLRKLKKKKVTVVRKHKRRVKKRRNRQAIVGFNPEDKKRIRSVLDSNPRLKFKVERLFSDIVFNPIDTPSHASISTFIVPPRLIKTYLKDKFPGFEQFPPDTKEEIIKRFNAGVLKHLDSESKLFIHPKGLEYKKELKKILEHETTHKAHKYRISQKKFAKITTEESKLAESIFKDEFVKRLFLSAARPTERKVIRETGSPKDKKALKKLLEAGLNIREEKHLNFIKLLRESNVPPLKEKPKIWVPERLGFKKIGPDFIADEFGTVTEAGKDRKNRGRDPSQFDSSFDFPFVTKETKKRTKLPASEVERTRVCKRCKEIFRTRQKFSRICPECVLPTVSRKPQKLIFPREKRRTIEQIKKRNAELEKLRLKWMRRQR